MAIYVKLFIFLNCIIIWMIKLFSLIVLIRILKFNKIEVFLYKYSMVIYVSLYY